MNHKPRGGALPPYLKEHRMHGLLAITFCILGLTLTIFTADRLTIHIIGAIYSWRAKVRCSETIDRTIAECAEMYAKDHGLVSADPMAEDGDQCPDKVKAMFRTAIERYLLNLVASDKP
jgi:hypothetical protein